MIYFINTYCRICKNNVNNAPYKLLQILLLLCLRVQPVAAAIGAAEMMEQELASPPNASPPNASPPNASPQTVTSPTSPRQSLQHEQRTLLSLNPSQRAVAGGDGDLLGHERRESAINFKLSGPNPGQHGGLSRRLEVYIVAFWTPGDLNVVPHSLVL